MQAARHELYPRASATLRPATCDLRPGWWWGEKHRGAIGGGIDFAQKKPKIGSRSKPNIFLRCWSWAAVSSFEPGITIATVLPIILQRLIFMAWHGIAWHSMACRNAVEAKPSLEARHNSRRRTRSSHGPTRGSSSPGGEKQRAKKRARERTEISSVTRNSWYHSTSDALPALLQHGTCLPATVS